jgi:Ca2+-binding EF-hand superfamily protein
MPKRKSEKRGRGQKSSFKQELTKRQMDDIQTAFNLFDTDGSGTIEVKELKVALRALGLEPKKDEIKDLLSEVVSEDKGDEEEGNTDMIDHNEFMQIMQNKMGERESVEEINAAYEHFFDEDEGGITFESLKRLAQEIEEEISDEELHEMLEEASKNNTKGDKVVISRADFKQVLNRATTSI